MSINNPIPEATPAHGGDVYHLARTLGLELADLLDFSANINPLGFPPGITGAIQQALGEIVHYPDRRCLELRRELAAYHHLSPEQILMGNGSTELIYLVARALAPRQALIVAPAFSEYEHALEVAQVPVAFQITTEGQNFTLAQPLDPKGADLVFLANPASPSGILPAPELLLEVAAALDAAGVHLLLDEAFIDFVEEASLKTHLGRFPHLLILRSFTKFFGIPGMRLGCLLAALDASGVYLLLDEAFIDFVEGASLKTHLGRFPHLLILRSFTKFFGIPGMRLGCLLAAPELIARLAAVQEPWSVSTLAQAMGRACLQDLDYMARSRVLVSRERAYLLAGLKSLPGLLPFPSAVNYLLVKITRPDWTAASLQKALLARKVVIRDASNFRGLDEHFFRVAVRRREENEQLLEALRHSLI